MERVMLVEPKVEQVNEPKKARHRSPNYPAIGLRKALEQVEKFYAHYKKAFVPMPVVHRHLGFTAGASVASQRIAAFKGYGLIEVQGESDKAEVRVSDRAYKIILKHQDRDGLLRAAALDPAIHAELWKKYGDDGLPPDDAIKHYLLFERSFNPSAVDGFIAQFKDTIQFAKLDSSGKIDGEDKKDDEQPDVGDFVQWESQGIAQFVEPKFVIGKSDDGNWLFVEGSQTGIPIAQAHRVEPSPGKTADMQPNTQQGNPLTGQPPQTTPPLNPAFRTAPPIASGIKQNVFSGETGEVIIRWPAVLSPSDLEDLEGWLDMVKRQIKRSVKTEVSE